MKIDCEIVQDLIPSYVEAICSESSKACVEEHIATCEECRALVKLYKETELSAEVLDQKQLDGFKKIRSKVKLQNILSYGLLLVLLLFGIYNFGINYNMIAPRWYYGLLAVAIAATYAATMQQQEKVNTAKHGKLFFLISSAAILYMLFVYGFVIAMAMRGKAPFGLEKGELGPFLHGQSAVVFLLQIGVLGYSLYGYWRKNTDCNLLMTVNLTGIFLIFAHTSLLGNLSDSETYLRNFTEITVVMVAIGVVGGLVLRCMEKRRK
ncbi:MAG: zf-HC2 domain-containing protein [Lachnospiraceae bacterium]